MAQRVAEHVVRRRPFGRAVRLRVDLHGVSVFGPGDEHRAIRWEWIERITVADGVVVQAAEASITLPPGAFGLGAGALAERLEQARSLDRRPEVIGLLGRGRAPG